MVQVFLGQAGMKMNQMIDLEEKIVFIYSKGMKKKYFGMMKNVIKHYLVLYAEETVILNKIILSNKLE